MVIIWLPLAEEALDNIHRFYKERSKQVASKMISDIRKAAERLVEQPDMAFREPLLKERSKVFRSLIVRKIYKIVYYNENNTVYIADIWDSRQDPNSLRDRHSSA